MTIENDTKTKSKVFKKRIYRKLLALILIAGSTTVCCVAALDKTAATVGSPKTTSFRGMMNNQTRRLSAIGNGILGYMKHTYGDQDAQKYFARNLNNIGQPQNVRDTPDATWNVDGGGAHEDKFLIFDPEDA